MCLAVPARVTDVTGVRTFPNPPFNYIVNTECSPFLKPFHARVFTLRARYIGPGPGRVPLRVTYVLPVSR